MIEANKKIVRNTLVQYFKIIFVALTTLVSVRIVLNQLGVSDYGIFTLIAGVLAFLGILSSALIVSTQRHISLHIASGDKVAVQSVYSASVHLHILLVVCIIIIAETLGLYAVNHILVFPPGRLTAANWVYQCALFAFALNILSLPQQAVMIAYEKMVPYSLISCLEGFLKLCGAIALIYIADDKLIYYALIFAGVSLIIRVIFNIYVVRTTGLRMSAKADRNEIRRLTSFASWNLLGGVANIGKIQGVNIILNLFFNTAINGSYGIANQVNSQLLTFSSSIFQSTNSQTIQAYKKNDSSRLDFLVVNITRFAFVLFFVFTVPIFIFTDQILLLWLNKVPVYSGIFLKLMIINSYVELFSTPLMFIMQANGNIKHYFITVSIVMLLILPISYMLLYFGCSAEMVLIVTILINMLLLKIRLDFVHKVAGYSYGKYVRSALLPISIIAVAILGAGYMVFRETGILSLGRLLCYVTMVMGLSGIVMGILLLKKRDVIALIKK